MGKGTCKERLGESYLLAINYRVSTEPKSEVSDVKCLAKERTS